VTTQDTPCGGPTSAGSTSGADCREALDRLFEYLDEEMPASDLSRIRAHMDECAPCLRELGIEEHVKKLVRRSCVEEAPAELHVRIREQILVLRERLEY
jgi:mycothiol system anti-sigma-R factor